MGQNYEVDENGRITSGGRLAVLEPPGTVFVDSIDDFPAPVAGVITLPAGKTKFVLQEPIVTANRFVIPAGAQIEFQADNIDDDILDYTGNDDFFTLVDFEDFTLEHIIVVNSGAGTLFSADGTATAQVTMFRCRIEDWTSLGLIKDVRFCLIRNTIFQDFGDGLTLEEIDVAALNLCLFTNAIDSGNNFITAKATVKAESVITASNCQMKTNPTEFAFLIVDPSNVSAILTNLFSITAGRLFDPAGKDETDNLIIAKDNVGQKDSMAVGTMFAQGNTTATVIAVQGTFVKLNLNALAVPDSNIERFTVTDTTTGELTYTGEADISVDVVATISSKKAAGGGDIQVAYRVVINDINGFEQTTEVRNTITETTVTKGIVLKKNDRVEIEVANQSDTSNIVIQDIRVSIK